MNKKDKYFDNCELLGLGKDAETLKDVLVYKVKENDFIWVKPLERILEDNIDECKILDVFNFLKEEFVYKLAIPLNNDNEDISDNLEDSNVFKILEITNIKNITNEYLIDVLNKDTKEKLDTLSINNVRILIANSLQDSTYDYARKLGIGIIVGASGKCENIIQDYIDGKLFCNKTKIIKTIKKEH